VATEKSRFHPTFCRSLQGQTSKTSLQVDMQQHQQLHHTAPSILLFPMQELFEETSKGRSL